MKMRFKRILQALAGAIPALIIMSIPAHAAGILDSTTSLFQGLEHGWFASLVGYARETFTLLAILEVSWLAITWMLSGRTFEEVIPSLTKKIIVLGFFAAILINAQTWIPSIINGGVLAGQTASLMPNLSPSTLASYAINMPVEVLTGQFTGDSTFGVILQTVKDTVEPSMWLQMIERILIAAMLFASFLYIAVEMMVLLIESYIVMGAGVIFLGFGGSRWTNKFVDNYINFAVSVAVKLFVLYLIVGAIVSTIVPAINRDFSATGGGLGGAFNLNAGLGACVVMIVAAMLAKKIPDHAGALLGAGAGMTAAAFGSEGGRAAGAVAMVGAGVLTGGAATAAGAAASAGGAAAGGAASTAGGAAAGAGGVAASSGAAGTAAPSAAAGSVGGSSGVSGSAGAGTTPPAEAPSASDLSKKVQNRVGRIAKGAINAGQILHSGGSDKSVSSSHISTSHGNE